MRTAMVLVAMLIASPAFSQPVPTWTVGIGRESCGSWLANPEEDFQASVWIFGFWTGANFYGGYHDVGASTDAMGIVESVRNICRDDPALMLAGAVSKLYRQFQQQGR